MLSGLMADCYILLLLDNTARSPRIENLLIVSDRFLIQCGLDGNRAESFF